MADGTRRLDFGFYGFVAGAVLALLAAACTLAFGIAPGRANSALVLAFVAALCAAGAAWRLRGGDVAFLTGALGYAATVAVGLVAILAFVSPIAFGLVENQTCFHSRCSGTPALTSQQQTGYNFAGALGALGLVANVLGVYFMTSERARRRQN
jgi:hypothetical protein